MSEESEEAGNENRKRSPERANGRVSSSSLLGPMLNHLRHGRRLQMCQNRRVLEQFRCGEQHISDMTRMRKQTLRYTQRRFMTPPTELARSSLRSLRQLQRTSSRS